MRFGCQLRYGLQRFVHEIRITQYLNDYEKKNKNKKFGLMPTVYSTHELYLNSYNIIVVFVGHRSVFTTVNNNKYYHNSTYLLCNFIRVRHE